jgi:hypothetical protein
VIVFVLLLAALILLVLAAFGVNGPRINTGWAGLACWVAAEVVTRWPG